MDAEMFFSENVPISGELSELPSLISRVLEKISSSVLNVRFIDVPFDTEMR